MDQVVQTSYTSLEVAGLWQQACHHLEKRLTPAVFQTWILANPLVQLNKTGAGLEAVVASPTAFHATNLKRNLNTELETVLAQVVGEPVTIHYRVGLNSSESLAPSLQSPRASDLFSENTLKQSREDRLAWKIKSVGLNPDYTFASFAVSSTNEMAHAAATAVAQNPGTSYNPLFLYGAVGVGKTHLMHAIGNTVLALSPDSNLVYCTGEEFTNQIVQAIQTKQASSFKHKFRNAQVLFIDDVQFIAGKNTVQEEFFHTFNALIQQKHQVVLTSDRPPHSISLLEDRLKSRFEAGLMIDIGQPSFELRTAIFLLKTRQAKLEVPIELAKLVAEQVESARQIEGFITLLRSEVELKGRALNEELITNLLRHPSSEKNSHRLAAHPSEVIRKVAAYFNIKQTELRGKSRQKHLVAARHLTMFILKEDLRLPLVEIGRWLANRDHTSVIHGVRRIQRELPHDERLRKDLDNLRARLA